MCTYCTDCSNTEHKIYTNTYTCLIKVTGENCFNKNLCKNLIKNFVDNLNMI